ncbi:MAG: hypothetical protein IPK93_03535 [Solirubrobacterales bacterium]|nr:hypothetical protein [Solirubrobacterales bacterium]
MSTALRALLFGALMTLGMAGNAHAMSPADLSPDSSLGRVFVTPDGSILAQGAVGGDGWHDPGTPLILKFRPDGEPDTDFAEGGALRLDSLKGQSAGLLYEPGAGMVVISGGSLMKLDASGSVDSGFGVNGTVSSISSEYLGGLRMTAIALDAVGGIVVAGGTYKGDFRLARFTNRGAPDESFGGDGTVQIAKPNPGGMIFPDALAVDRLSRIVAVDGTGRSPTAMRLMPNGDLDPSFGPGGNGFTGPFEPEDVFRDFTGSRDLVIGPDGGIHLYGVTNPNVYFYSNVGYFLDPDGKSEALFHDYGFGGSGVFAETPGGGIATTEAPFRGQSFGFSVGRSDADFWYKPRLAPKETNTNDITYSPSDNTLVSVGEAKGSECTATCSDKTYGVIAKIDADSGKPVPGFGTGGAKLVPENKCSYGEAEPFDPGVSTPWHRCRVKPPRIKPKIAVAGGGGRKPGFRGHVRLAAAPTAPAFLKRTLRIKLPKRLKLKRDKARNKLYARVIGAGEAETKVSLKGRVITIKLRPGSSGFDPNANYPARTYPPENGPVSFKFGIKRGGLKPIGKASRHMRLGFRLRATYAASGTFSEDFDGLLPEHLPTSAWAGPNSATKVVRVRPTGKVPRAGR